MGNYTPNPFITQPIYDPTRPFATSTPGQCKTGLEDKKKEKKKKRNRNKECLALCARISARSAFSLYLIVRPTVLLPNDEASSLFLI